MFTGKPPWYHKLSQYHDPYQFFYWMTTTNEELSEHLPSDLSPVAKEFLSLCLKR